MTVIASSENCVPKGDAATFQPPTPTGKKGNGAAGARTRELKAEVHP
jgi:hypothetical protein